MTLPPKRADIGTRRTVSLDASALASSTYLYQVHAETPIRTAQAVGRMMLTK